MDMFTDYAARGDAFAAAVREHDRHRTSGRSGDDHWSARRPIAAAPAPVQVRARSAAAGSPPLREALDRPLTTYYLLLGAIALLLTIGLIMVLSASSV